MYSRFVSAVLLMMLGACSSGGSGDASPESANLSLAQYEAFEGFLDIYWDNDGGRLLLKVDELDEPLLYQSSMARGVGSNDLGLDRGQLGGGKIVRFVRNGPKVLLIEDNLAYRAISDDADERNAVEESFARSVIWGFEIIEEGVDGLLLDGTEFFTRDAVGIAGRLERAGEWIERSSVLSSRPPSRRRQMNGCAACEEDQ